jgi:hypothetical protein
MGLRESANLNRTHLKLPPSVLAIALVSVEKD